MKEETYKREKDRVQQECKCTYIRSRLLLTKGIVIGVYIYLMMS